MSVFFGFLLNHPFDDSNQKIASTIHKFLRKKNRNISMKTDVDKGLCLIAENIDENIDACAVSCGQVILKKRQHITSLWKKQQDDLLDELEGSFSLALWDGSALNLATDAFGSHLIYYAMNSEGFFFSTLPDLLIDTLGINFHPTAENISSFMTLGFIPAPSTGYRGLRALEPSSYIKIKNGEICFHRKYWAPPKGYKSRLKNLKICDKHIDKIEHILENQVNSYIEAIPKDKKIAIPLSGGTASTLLCILAAKKYKKRISPVHVELKAHPEETERAKKIAEHLGLELNILKGDSSAKKNEILKNLSDFNAIPNDYLPALFMEDILKKIKSASDYTMLSFGADELFFCADKYAYLYKNRISYRIPAMLFKPFMILFNPIMQGHKKWERMKLFLNNNRSWKYASLINNRLGNVIDKLDKKVAVLEHHFPSYDGDIVYQARYFDLLQNLPYGHLPMINMACYKNNIKPFYPFLNRSLFGLLSGINQRNFLAYKNQEKILTKILSKYLPEDIVPKKKHPFKIPTRYDEIKFDKFNFSQNEIPKSITDIAWINRKVHKFKKINLRLNLLGLKLNKKHDV